MNDAPTVPSDVLVSVVMAVSGLSKYLSQAINSVTTQTHKNIEIVFVIASDHLLQTEIERVLGGFRNYKMVIETPRAGLYGALNEGVNYSSGDLVGFVHSDDFLANNKIISRLAEIFKSHDQPDLVYGSMMQVDRDTLKFLRAYNASEVGFGKNNLLHPPGHCALFFSKAHWNRVGCFNLSFKIASDVDWMIRAFSTASNIASCSYMVSIMRTGGISTKNIRSRIRILFEINLIFFRNFGWRGVKVNLRLLRSLFQ